MKVATFCAAGNCRSVALARVLKFYGHEALACSWGVSFKTMQMLCDWADLVVALEAKGQAKIPAAYDAKLRLCDVGPDRWKNPINDELTELCDTWIRSNGLWRPR